jgi:hypothetical protein
MAFRPAQIYTGTGWDDVGDPRINTTDAIPQASVNGLTTSLGSKADLSVSLNPQTGNYTFVIGDAGKLVTVNSSSAQTVTIPTDASVAFPVGTAIGLAALGTGAVSIAGAAGVTVNSLEGATPALSDQYAGAQCYKISTDTWLVVGSLG